MHFFGSAADSDSHNSRMFRNHRESVVLCYVLNKMLKSLRDAEDEEDAPYLKVLQSR